VFGCESMQIDVYNQVVRPVVKEVLEGYNCTIFAYGQTGTGKTYTMEGYHSSTNENFSWENDPDVGIIPRTVAQLFSLLSSMSNCEHSVKISYMELYNEELTDLLSDSQLDKDEKLKIYDDPARKGSVIVSKLEDIIVQNKNQVFKILQKGADRRQKASTLMNNQSSRSHSIFTITVFIKDRAIEGVETIKVGKLNLVDLAGSENIERSGATGKRATEAGKINKSLTTLGRVITALVQHSDHIPYRESNLTRLLQDSLGGKTKTTIIATISPALCNLEETLSTLDYAHKAKSIRNKPEINQKLVKKELIKEFNEEIERLKRELNATREKNGVYLPTETYQEMESNTNMLKMEIREYIKKLAMSSEELDLKSEENKKLKEEMQEKNEVLYQTECQLGKTNTKIEQMENELRACKIIATERFKSEEKLAEQMSHLFTKNSDYESDNLNMSDKINRLIKLNDKNRLLVNQFSDFINDKISNLNVKEDEILSLSKQKTSNLTELLKEVTSDIKLYNDDKIQLLDLCDKKLRTWLDSQINLVEKDLECFIKEHFDMFKQTVHLQSMTFSQTCDDMLKLCQEHRENYSKIWSKMTNSIDNMSKDFNNFESNFSNLTNEFLVSYAKDSNESNTKLLNNLTHLIDSTESNRNDLNDLINFKQSIKDEISESFMKIEDLMKNVSSKINSKFEHFDKQCSKLQEKTESNSKILNDLKESFTKEHETKKIKNFSSNFDRKVNEPVKNFIDHNTKNLIELNVLAKSLNEKHEAINSHYSNSIQGLKMTEEEICKNTTQILGSEYEQLEKISKKIQTSLNDYQTNTSKYFEKLQSQIIKSDEEITKKVEESIDLSHEIKHQNEHLSELNRDGCTKVIREASNFSEKEYEDYIATGKTPKKKEPEPSIELIQPKSDLEILEMYRSTNDDFKPPFYPITPVISDSLIVLTSSSESMRPLKISETTNQQGQKRGISDKENFSDLGEKASKVKKLISNSRLKIN
ncbi:unnamed protein product, partial [Brachionus calyciflorus]